MIPPRAPTALLLAALAGCASSPLPRFYTLEGPALATPTRADPARLRLSVGPVSVPDSVDREEIVLRTGGNRLELSDLHRWAEPLPAAIARVLAADLGRALGTPWAGVRGQWTGGEPDLRVAVDVLRFDSALGQAATVEAAWEVRRKDGGPALQGRTLAREPTAGEGYDALAAAHARALARIARDIAAAIRRDGG